METWFAWALTNALLATVLAVGVYWVGKWLRHPPLLHVLWAVVLLKFLTPPLASWSLPVPGFLGDLLPDSTAAGAMRASGPRSPTGQGTTAVSVAHGNDALSPNRSAGYRLGCSAALGIWLSGSLTCVGLCVSRHRRLRRLLRHTRPAPSHWQSQAEALAIRLGLRRCPTVWTVPGRVPPMVVFGLGGARVVLPQQLVGRFNASRRAAVLLHELAHLRRGHQWTRRLEWIVRVLYWWYPPIIWIGRQVRAVEEKCCDWLVVADSPEDRREYAAVLLDTVDFAGAATSSGTFRAVLAMSAFCPLKRRLTMVLSESSAVRRSPRLAVILVVLASAMLPLGFRFADADEVQVGDPQIPKADSPSPEKVAVAAKKRRPASGRSRSRPGQVGRMDATVVVPPTQYHVRFRVIRREADGEEYVLSSPQLITTEGHEAVVAVGGKVAVPQAVAESRPIEFGLTFRAKISRRKGATVLDSTFRATSVQEADGKRVRLTTSELRAIERVEFGKQLTLAVPGTDAEGARTRLELLITEIGPAGHHTVRRHPARRPVRGR